MVSATFDTRPQQTYDVGESFVVWLIVLWLIVVFLDAVDWFSLVVDAVVLVLVLVLVPFLLLTMPFYILTERSATRHRWFFLVASQFGKLLWLIVVISTFWLIFSCCQRGCCCCCRRSCSVSSSHDVVLCINREIRNSESSDLHCGIRIPSSSAADCCHRDVVIDFLLLWDRSVHHPLLPSEYSAHVCASFRALGLHGSFLAASAFHHLLRRIVICKYTRRTARFIVFVLFSTRILTQPSFIFLFTTFSFVFGRSLLQSYLFLFDSTIHWFPLQSPSFCHPFLLPSCYFSRWSTYSIFSLLHHVIL